MKSENVPNCVGIIMDGNRRWAVANGLPKVGGHKAGYENLRKFVKSAEKFGVKNVIAFTFSTENWNRTKEEVDYLMGLFKIILSQELKKLIKDGIKLKFVGNLSMFSKDLQDLMEKAEKDTVKNKGPLLALAMSYGGRAEILNAVSNIRKTDGITEKDFEKALWTKDIPDPDMVIRTGGQKRLSGFLPWQTVYSELFFTDTFWPDFSEKEFKLMLVEFAERQRNFGK